MLNQLFTNQRTGADENTIVSRTDFQRDYDRVIFSTAFRRLQNKTQVFPLPGSVFVHNRLTHSLEVSSVGRSLGSLVGEFIVGSHSDKLNKEAKAFYLYNLHNVVAAACLCHDIGNPAFGHSGEDAIASYFERNLHLKSLMNEKQWADLINFEGNANAIRILTHQQKGKDKGGLQLTMTTLASIAKYPCEAIAKDKKILHRKKFGFFQSEKNTFLDIAQHTGMKQDERAEHLVFRRHPFVNLVEAADDICYNIIDIEDAQRLGIISTNDCENLLLDLLQSTNENLERVKNKLAIISNKNERVSYLRAKVINALINVSFELYKAHFDEILAGNLDQSLLSIFKNENKTLQEIERFSVEKIYNHKAVVEIENAGYNVMYELLNHFVPSVIKKNPKSYDKKALQLMPEQFHYQGEEVYHRILGVLDFVSGMTDNYATDLYRKIKGIDIGMTM